MSSARRPRFSVAQIEAALVASGSLHAQAAAQLAKAIGRSCTRQTIDNYVRRHPHLAQVAAEQRAILVDVAEHQLKRAVARGAAWAIRAVLFGTPEGRARGYSYRTELSGSNDRALQPGVIVVPEPVEDLDAWRRRYAPANVH